MTRRKWTAEEDATLRRLYPDVKSEDVARQLGRNLPGVYQRAYSLGLRKSAAFFALPTSGRTNGRQGIGTRFVKGQVPPNKGLRRPGWGPGRMKETQFKKGHGRSGVAVALYQPIGTERVSKDGYRERKVNDGWPLQRRWRAVHLVLWEEAHGPLPKGHAIAFLNGDKADIRLDNLECIPRAELMRRNTVHNYPKPLAETIQLLGALKRKIRNRERTHGQEQNQRSA